MNKETQAALHKTQCYTTLPPDWYAVYSGSEKLDLGNKSPIAFVKYEAHAKELISKYGSFGYYEKLGGNVV